MGFGTTLYTTIYYNRETFRSKSDVEEKLQDAEKELYLAKEQMRALVFMTEPNKFFEISDECDAFDALEYKYERTMERLLEAQSDVRRYSILLEEWDNCHDKEGNAICPPEDIPYDACYLSGDFVDMVYPDGKKVE